MKHAVIPLAPLLVFVLKIGIVMPGALAQEAIRRGHVLTLMIAVQMTICLLLVGAAQLVAVAEAVEEVAAVYLLLVLKPGVVMSGLLAKQMVLAEEDVMMLIIVELR